MLNHETLTRRLLDSLIGAAIFFAVLTGGTYLLQSTLILFKKYGAHAHWMAILIALPLIAGLLLRLYRISYPLASALIGAAGSAALLYPLYRGFWAEPPTPTDLAIYAAAVFGIGFIASQPLRTTVMIAFRLGRYSLPRLKAAANKPVQKGSLGTTQRLQNSENSNLIAIFELLIGVSSLALSVFSVFFLGRS